jgi:hypothetical protein
MFTYTCLERYTIILHGSFYLGYVNIYIYAAKAKSLYPIKKEKNSKQGASFFYLVSYNLPVEC